MGTRLRLARGAAAQAGFTMIELLVVMVILGLLAAVVGPDVINQGAKARVHAARLQMTTITTALNALALDTGRYPTTQEGLHALIEAPAEMNNWSGPYMDADAVPLDPWGSEYVYQGPEGAEKFSVLSLGSDGRTGGSGDAADITSRPPRATAAR